MFEEIYGNVQGWEQNPEEKFRLDYLPEAEVEVPPGSFIGMNMKMFKMVFNRALRVKSRDYSRGEAMFNYLIGRLEKLLGTPNTYYAALLYFELVRTANSTKNDQLALEHLEKGRAILDTHYGGPNKANYIDFYMRKIELFVNFVLDHNSAATKPGQE